MMNDESLTAEQIANALREQLGLKQAAEDKEEEILTEEIEGLSEEARRAQHPKPPGRPANIREPQAWQGSPMQLAAARRKQSAEAIEQIAEKQARLDAIQTARRERESATARDETQAKEAPLIAELAELQKDPTHNRARIKQIKELLKW